VIVKTGAALRGSSTYGLVAYLMGPGRANEHTDARVIAGAGPVEWLQPTSRTDGRPGLDVRGLVRHLDQHLLDVPGGPPAKHVFHTIMANPVTDRVLTDDEWAVAAYDMMRELGLAGTEQGLRDIRWIAIRHDDAHIHLAGTLVRADGSVAHTPNDFKAAAVVRARMEARYGLTLTNSGDRTASIRPTRAEVEKATRQERVETERETVRRLVRAAAATARSGAEFRSELASSGVRFEPRRSTVNPGEVTGYKASLRLDLIRGDRRSAEPVWFAGGGLDKDLTWPKLTARWAPAVRPEPATGHETPTGPRILPPAAAAAGLDPAERARVDAGVERARIEERVAAMGYLTLRAAAAAAVLHDDPTLVDTLAPAAADVTAVVAAAWAGHPDGRSPLGGATTAADRAQRAGRTPGGGGPAYTPRSALLRTAVRSMQQAGQLSSSADTGAWLALAVQVAAMLDAVAAARAAQARADQAEAAYAAAAGLRAHAALARADLPAAGPPPGVLDAVHRARAARAAAPPAVRPAAAPPPVRPSTPTRRRPPPPPPTPRRTR